MHFGGIIDIVDIAGVIVDSKYRGQGAATSLIQKVLEEEQPDAVIACTRNPGFLRALGGALGLGPETNLLGRLDPHMAAVAIKGATVDDDGIAYHIGRYGDGLYGDQADPAGREYCGAPLSEQCSQLALPGNALALYIDLGEIR